jgi:hypothetical protein
MPDFDTVSTPLVRQLAEDAGRNELRAIVQFAFLQRPLGELLRACQDAALDLIVLKGAALAETVYPRPSLRSFGDIDVLVRPEDAIRAHGVLTALGYVVEPARWAEVAAGQECEANFFQHTERGPVVVELHTKLLNNALLRRQVHWEPAGLWLRAQPARLAGQEARVLGPEDQLLHLCLHLAGHYFDAPNSLRDMVQVCAAYSVDWPLFTTLCRDANAAAIGYSGLFAAALAGASVPPAILEFLAPRWHRRVLEQMVTARVSGLDGFGAQARRFLLLWLVLDSPGARRSAVGHLFFPSQSWLHAHYYHALFDPPDRPSQNQILMRFLRHLPLGGVLYGMHMRFLLRQCRKLLVDAVRKPGRK